MEKRVSRFLALFFGVLLLAGCGSTKKDSYQLTQNGCDTGKQEFEADDEDELKKKVCAALQDDARNKGCAHALRQETFKEKGCPGEFTPH